MKVGIYDPYFSILGGAERYILSIASCLTANGCTVTIFTDNPLLIQKAQEKFGLTVQGIKSKEWAVDRSTRNKELKQLDKLFYVTDGSLFFSSAKQNILIIQSPAHIPIPSLINKLKLRNWHIVCYSSFMQGLIRKKLGKNPEILFVPIEKPQKIGLVKENLIISVGRFFPNLHNKKQIEMVELFRQLIDGGLKDTRLCLLGSVDPGGENYLEEVKKKSKGYPIEIKTDFNHLQLVDMYARSKVYWHATGFGEDLSKNPEKAEHFGVSTIEAMSYHVAPVVFAGGGQTEIVHHGDNGFLWKKGEELQKYTQELLQSDEMRERIASHAFRSAMEYTQRLFCQRLNEILT